MVLVVALAVRESHQQAAVGDGRHAHQRIAQPLLPHRFAARGNDLQLATFRIERHAAVGHDGRRRSIVAGLVPPEHLARLGVETVELVAAETAADEELPLDDGRGGQGMVAGDLYLPTLPLAVLRCKRLRDDGFRRRTALATAFCEGPTGPPKGSWFALAASAGGFFALAGFAAWAWPMSLASHASPTKVQNTDRDHTLHDMTHLLFRKVNNPTDPASELQTRGMPLEFSPAVAPSRNAGMAGPLASGQRPRCDAQFHRTRSWPPSANIHLKGDGCGLPQVLAALVGAPDQFPRGGPRKGRASFPRSAPAARTKSCGGRPNGMFPD